MFLGSGWNWLEPRSGGMRVMGSETEPIVLREDASLLELAKPDLCAGLYTLKLSRSIFR